MLKITNLLVFIIPLALIACSSAESKRIKMEEEQKITDSIRLVYSPENADKRIDEFMKRLHSRSAFNGNVLVAKGGKIIYKNSFGWADYLHRDSLNINSQFELASVSKPLTATAILMLIEQGKLRLDQTVNDFFPDFPYEGVTIKQLLSHRSGLPNYVYFVDGIWKDKRKGLTNKEVIDLLIEHKPGRYNVPDARFLYNNSNFMVLAAIVEVVSGESFTVFMQENIFKPLGMKNTAVYSKADYETIPTRVIGHDKVWRRSVVQNFLDGPVGDKGIYSTVDDLYLFDRALVEGRVIGKELLDSAYVGRSKPTNGVFNYGYGWRLYEKGDHIIAYHTGWWHGFKNLYIRDLKNDITIILLSNMANASLNRLDDLYGILDMPVIRQGAYSGNGELMD
ncbi:serine hydrolase domain-containing protein [Albibacterium bauzanense]|uniref:CubicO group peptidase (Beta-lactamase class C family) n=1 Tax=Albibacterium bauzanense TaxID=653929 RepID=A0A4R1LWP1_9SPHI|nr:serine hydrolase domain-containing protein [Albibacterium bauzanense]TCK82950.1 CubicO group peptidase (beta-lactamase class C family) [Albibacterium bauzanense]